MATYTILVQANAGQALTSAGALQAAFGNLNQITLTTSRNLQGAFEAAAGSAKTLALAIGAAAAAFAGFSLAALIKEGFRFNQVLENTRLSIASLVAAFDQTDGRSVGEKLSVGLTIAQDQLKKLRVDALTTSATFEELATGFQTAIGTGLGKGLNLDQIRTLTLQIGQGAKVFNLQSNQISSEIKDILSGNITRNSTIATSLKIKPEDIKKFQGDADALFKYLQDKLGSFRQAGVLAANTFGGLLSNAQEAFTTLAASATEKTFEATKQRLSGILGSVFDLKNSGLDKNLQPIVDLFDRIGVKVVNGLGDALEFVVNKVKDFGKLLNDNPDLVDRIVERFQELVSTVTDLFKGFLAAFDPSNGRDFLYQLEQALILTRQIVQVAGTIAQIFGTVAAGISEIFRAVVYGGEQDYEKIIARQKNAERAVREAEERRKREEEAKKKALPTIQTEKQKPDEIQDLEKKISDLKKVRDALRAGSGPLFNLEEDKASLDEEINRIKSIRKLRRELGLDENQRITESLEGQKDEIQSLEKIKSAREALVALTRQQADAQLAVSQAAAASLLPVLDAQTRADRIFFESIRNRKEAEADLQASIIQQIRERSDLEAQSARDRATQLGVIQERIQEDQRLRDEAIALGTRAALNRGESTLLNELRSAANKPPVIPTKIDATNELLTGISTLVARIADQTKNSLTPGESGQLPGGFLRSSVPAANPFLPAPTIGPIRSSASSSNPFLGGSTGGAKKRTRFSGNAKIDLLIDAAAEKYNLDPDILTEQLRRESINFKPAVLSGEQVSTKGAIGIAQFIPGTAKRFGVDPLNLESAIFGAARYDRLLLDQFGGDYELALAGYNAGEGRGKFKSPTERLRYFLRNIKETRDYVPAILRNAGRGLVAQPSAEPSFEPTIVSAGPQFIQGSRESNLVQNLDGSIYDPLREANQNSQRFFGADYNDLSLSRRRGVNQRLRESQDSKQAIEDQQALLEIDRQRVQEIIDFERHQDAINQSRRVEIDQVTERARLEERIRKLQEGDPLTERDLRQTYDNSVLAERANLLEQNRRLEYEIGDAGVNSAERLRNAYLTATKARVDAEQLASEQIVRTQVELADKYTYRQTQTTAIVLDNINRQTKSLSQIAADYQTGLFDLVNNGLGRGIDAITKKLGFAGSLVGQLLKDLARLALNKLFLGLLGLNGGGGGGWAWGAVRRLRAGDGNARVCRWRRGLRCRSRRAFWSRQSAGDAKFRRWWRRRRGRWNSRRAPWWREGRRRVLRQADWWAW